MVNYLDELNVELGFFNHKVLVILLSLCTYIWEMGKMEKF